VDVDKKAFLDARSAARDIRGKLAEVDGDARAAWLTAQKLLHSKPPIYQNDAECASLSLAFSQFFVGKYIEFETI
jgi:hypothetical protein